MSKATGASLGNPSYLSLRELKKRWKVADVEELGDHIRREDLTCYLFAPDDTARLHREEDGGPTRIVLLKQYYRLPAREAVIVFGRQGIGERVDFGGSSIIVGKDPDCVAVLEHWRAGRDDLFVSREEIEQFEQHRRESEPPPKDRRSVIHRERCRAVAALLWEQHPDLNIEEMVNRPEITKYGQEDTAYLPKTIRNWIHDLCPDARPGRPRSKK